MCRNIRPLFNFDPPATAHEIDEASLQFVRKVSGYSRPSGANEVAFNQAVMDISAIVTRLLGELETTSPPKNRDVEAEKRRTRSANRFARA